MEMKNAVVESISLPRPTRNSFFLLRESLIKDGVDVLCPFLYVGENDLQNPSNIFFFEGTGAVTLFSVRLTRSNNLFYGIE